VDSLIKGLYRLIALLVLITSSLALAAAGSAGRIVVVADSRRFTGWRAWCTNLYNEDLAWFTLLTITVISVLAVTLGFLASFVLARVGINLTSGAPAKE
jgi:hypothetical protein